VLCVAEITVNILTGILPIEAQLHIRALGLFNNICNQLESSIEKSLARRQLLIKNNESASWFIVYRMYVPVSSFNFIGHLAASTAEWQLILNRG
jgi:hypothetical protein